MILKDLLREADQTRSELFQRLETITVCVRMLMPDDKGPLDSVACRQVFKRLDGDSAPSPDQATLGDARHSDDFRSVHWYGVDYTFTASQAACVKVLWRNWDNRTPEIGEDTILTDPEVDAAAKRLIDLFRQRNSPSGYHPAWGTMIVQGRKGAYRLQAPDKK